MTARPEAEAAQSAWDMDRTKLNHPGGAMTGEHRHRALFEKQAQHRGLGYMGLKRKYTR